MDIMLSPPPFFRNRNRYLFRMKPNMYWTWYYTDSIVFLADNVDLADISHFLLITWCFSWWKFKFEKSHVGIPSGPTGSPHVIFQIWTSITKNIMLLSKKMWDTQPNPRYSAKNNDAIRMISSFMPNHYLMFCWSFLFYNSSYLRS